MAELHRNRVPGSDKGRSCAIQHAGTNGKNHRRFIPKRASLLLVGVLLLMSATAHAEYHGQNASPEVRAWFAYLKIPPLYVEGCCGYHRDCWETEAYYRNGRWWALYRPFAADPKAFNKDARIIPIPHGSIESEEHLYRRYNLTKRPVLCALPHVPPQFGEPSVYCFVPPPTSF